MLLSLSSGACLICGEGCLCTDNSEGGDFVGVGEWWSYICGRISHLTPLECSKNTSCEIGILISKRPVALISMALYWWSFQEVIPFLILAICRNHDRYATLNILIMVNRPVFLAAIERHQRKCYGALQFLSLRGCVIVRNIGEHHILKYTVGQRVGQRDALAIAGY